MAAPAGAELPRGPYGEPGGPGVAAPLTTFATPNAAVKGHLLEVASSSRPVSPFVATDLSALESELETQDRQASNFYGGADLSHDAVVAATSKD